MAVSDVIRRVLSALGPWVAFSFVSAGFPSSSSPAFGQDVSAEPPRFSPDGKKIVFESKRDGDVWQIFLMNLDGSEVRQLTQTGARHPNGYLIENASPSFAPDGKRIVFKSNETASGWLDLYIMDLSDGSWRQITYLQARVATPVFSPMPIRASGR